MNNYSEMQHELMLLWKSRMKSVEGLTETGKKFEISKPMNYLMTNSQKSYKAVMGDMKKQMKLMRKQMAVLQKEMNDMLKLMSSANLDEDKNSPAY